jgi:hypothetical protein
MAWTAPPTFAVSEVVTAARMNILSDDLSYLKGNAGTVAIGADIAPTGVAASRNDGSYQFTCERTTAVARKYGFAVSGSDGSFGLDDVTVGARRFTVGVGGYAGLGGVTTPQGPLHALGLGGGFLFLSANAVDGTLQTLVVAGTVTQTIALWGYDRNNTSAGLAIGSGAMLTLGTTYGFVNTDTVTVTLTGGGAITVQRTAGSSGTHQVNLIVMYK